MVPSVMTTFGTQVPSAEVFCKVQLLLHAPLVLLIVFSGWFRIAKHFLCRALVRGRGIVFRHHNQSVANSAGKDIRDDAAVPFE